MNHPQYDKHYAEWKRTLPDASHEVLHAKTLAHIAWEEQSNQPKQNLATQIIGASSINVWYVRAIIILLALIWLTILVKPAHAQFSRISSVQFQQGGSSISGGFFTFPYVFNCSTNVTCTVSGNTLTITASSTASTAFSTLTAGTNSNAGTFAVSANTWDFSAATQIKLRVGAGLTTSANGDCGFDTTNKNWHCWGNAVDNFVAVVPTALSVTNGHLVTWSLVGGVLTLADGGAPAGATWAGLTPGTNSTAGTFAATGNTWDFSGSTLFKLRVAAGLTTSANGDCGYDTTGTAWHCFQNALDRFMIVSTNKGTLGQAALSNADGTFTFADPIVSGPDAPGVAPTKNPVQIGGFDGTNVQRIKTDTSGNLSAVLAAGGNVIGALSANQSVNVNQYGGVGTSLGQKASVSSIPVVPANDYLPSDTVGSTIALNGANAQASVAVSGQQGAGAYIISGGSLIGTVVPEVSYNGASGPWLASFFYNPTTGVLSTSLAVNSPTDIYLTILTPSGTSNARIRVSSYTSGSSNAVVRATFALVTPLPLLPSNPVGTEYGVIVRNIPSGTQTITGAVNASQSGTYTVQPGNTQNTTPWEMTITDNVTPANKATVDASGQLKVNCATGCSASAPADGTASGTIGALNAAVQISMAGLNSASFSLPASNNLVATLIPESSTDGGTTWSPGLVRQQGSTSNWAANVAVSSQNANWDILVPGGASHVRIRANPYTSGSTTASLRATQQPEAFSPSTGAAGSAVPQAITQVGGSDGTNLRALSTSNTGKLLVTPDSVALPAHQSTNVDQLNGTTTDTNSGTKSAGTLRVVLATDQPQLTNKLLVTPDSVALPANQSVNVSQMNGITTSMGNGTTDTGTQRVSLSSDSTGQVIPAPTTASGDAVSVCNILSAASTNSTSCKGSAGNFYGYEIYNTTTTIYYLRLYNTSAAPTCSSATGFIRSIPIVPASASGGSGGQISNQPFPVNYGTGIGYCITGGSSSTDNTNAAVGVFGEIRFK